MSLSEVPPVHPCVRSRNRMDTAFDYTEVVCDGKAHVNVSYLNGVEVTRSKPHDCDRWRAHALRAVQLKKGASP